jgi:hypothetical protein
MSKWCMCGMCEEEILSAAIIWNEMIGIKLIIKNKKLNENVRAILIRCCLTCDDLIIFDWLDVVGWL